MDLADRVRVAVTDAGKEQWSAIRSAVSDVTEELWGDLPDQDIATAGRVLNIVLSRRNAILERP
jgi:DNA-binding MarR family transcriptional regulator